MSKILGISTLFLFFGLVAFGQNADAGKCSKKKSCVSVEQCAAEMGMTKAECQAKCKTQCKSASATSGSSKQMGSYAGYSAPGSEKKAECSSVKQCAKATGMTKAECQAKCKSTKSAANQSKTELHAKK